MPGRVAKTRSGTIQLPMIVKHSVLVKFFLLINCTGVIILGILPSGRMLLIV